MKLNKGLLLGIIILAFASIVFSEDALSWSGATHRILSNHAALRSASNQADYFVNYLGFKNGLEESFTWGKKQKAIEWMQDGCSA